MSELVCDPERTEGLAETGIYVRAKRNGSYASVDILELTKESLVTWLRSRGGDNPWAEDVVCVLLGHDNARWVARVKGDK